MHAVTEWFEGGNYERGLWRPVEACGESWREPPLESEMEHARRLMLAVLKSFSSPKDDEGVSHQHAVCMSKEVVSTGLTTMWC